MDWIVANNIGDLASVAGLAISIVGFAVTLWNVARSRSAAERAEEAANQARSRFRLFDTIGALTEAMAMMTQIQQLHRERAWGRAIASYPVVARLLREVGGMSPDLTRPELSALQDAHPDMLSIERRVDGFIQSGQEPDGFGQFNRLLSRHIRNIHNTLLAVKQRTRV